MRRSLFLRHRLRGRDEMAAFLQHEERSSLDIATDQVEDHIDLLLQNLLEPRRSMVDDTARSKRTHVRLIVAACGRNDRRTRLRGQLHRIRAHRARPAMDQDRLSLFYMTINEEPLPAPSSHRTSTI